MSNDRHIESLSYERGYYRATLKHLLGMLNAQYPTDEIKHRIEHTLEEMPDGVPGESDTA